MTTLRNSNSLLTVNLLFSFLLFASPNDGYTVKSVIVVYRQGDRTPKGPPHEFYPNDPYVNETYGGLGYDALTPAGISRISAFGQSLRKRYYDLFKKNNEASGEPLLLGGLLSGTDDLLSSSETQDFSAYCYNNKRAKESTNYLLKALYPTLNEGSGLENLHVLFDYTSCPKFRAAAKKYILSKKVSLNTMFEKQNEKLSQHTGISNFTILDGYNLYHQLKAQKEANLELPEWTKDYFPGLLYQEAKLFHTELYGNDEIGNLIGGYILRNIVKNIKDIKNNNNPKKLYVYGGHGIDLYGVLNNLNFWDFTVPEYSSAVIFEVYETNFNRYVKILHYKGIPAEYEQLRFYGHPDEDIYFNMFHSILEISSPSDLAETCY